MNSRDLERANREVLLFGLVGLLVLAAFVGVIVWTSLEAGRTLGSLRF